MLLASRLSDAGVPSWDLGDLIISRALVCCVLLSAFADQQQWAFQNAKQSYLKTAKVPAGFEQADLDRGFVVTGLWSWSRHPNFAGEQTFWVALYQWGCYVTGSMYNWSAIGAIGYIALFQASTWFTELVSADKYPEYKEYQARVGKFLPRLSTEPMGGWEPPVGGAERKTLGGDDVDKEKEKDATKARERYNLR